MGISDDYIRTRRSPPSSGRHPASSRKEMVVGILSGKQTPQSVFVHPAHSGESACGSCEHLQFPGQVDSPCSKVAGRVRETDTCSNWTTRDQGSLGVQSQGENIE